MPPRNWKCDLSGSFHAALLISIWNLFSVYFAITLFNIDSLIEKREAVYIKCACGFIWDGPAFDPQERALTIVAILTKQNDKLYIIGSYVVT